MLAQGLPDSRIRVHAYGQLVVDLDLHGDPQPDAPYLSAMLTRQPNVERVLRDHVASLGGTIERGCELIDLRQDGDRVLATVQDATTQQPRVLRTAYLVGCDGARSQVRHLLGFAFEGETTAEHLAVGDMDVAWDQPPDPSMWLHPDGMLIGGRLPGSPVWNLAATLRENAAGEVEPASAALFERLMHEWAGVPNARVTKTYWLSNYTVNRRMVDHYRRGRAFVAGDAAHIHSPAGGQGMNTGIQDAFNLGWKLALVVQDKSADTLLDTYEEERRPVAQALLRRSSTLQSTIFSPSPVLTLLRNDVLLPLLRRPAVRRAFLYRLAQLNITYRGSSLAPFPAASRGIGDRLRVHGAPGPGDRAPDAPGNDARTGAGMSLFDVFRGPHFTLLVFTGKSPRSSAEYAPLVAIARGIEERLGDDVRACLVTSGVCPEWVGDILLDPTGEAHRIYGTRTEAVYLIRPDGYVAFRGDATSWVQLQDYLGRIFLRLRLRLRLRLQRPTPRRESSVAAAVATSD